MQMDKMEMASGENEEDFFEKILGFLSSNFLQNTNKPPIILCSIFFTPPPPSPSISNTSCTLKNPFSAQHFKNSNIEKGEEILKSLSCSP